MVRWEHIDANVAPVDNLILNLSVGWLPELSGSQHGQLTEPVRAVLDILVEARCRGAMIVVAAGNDQGGTGDRTGLMYPAAWHDETAYCPGGVIRRPLLYAVGGVDGIDQPLASGRIGGRPRLAAPADHAVVEHRLEAGVFTEPMTGTSVAAAVMSAAAAVVWGYDPALSPEAVAEIVYESGIDLGTQANGCAGPACTIRRISICQAIRRVCTTGAANPTCPARLPTCAPGTAGRDERPDDDFGGVDLVDLVDTQLVSASNVWSGSLVQTSCGGATYATTQTPQYPCPFEQRDTTIAKAWVDPQPDMDVCPPCFLKRLESEMVMYVEVNRELPGPAQDLVLQLHTSAGDIEFYELPPGAWFAGDVFKIVDIKLPEDDLVAVKLTYNVYDGVETPYSGAEPIIFY